MSQKTRVLNVRVVGFSAPERQMLNSIFLLSVAPARQIGYKLWNSESGTAPDMYLLDGDSESAVASWQAAFSDAVERTLVVGSKNTDLGCTSAARPLGLKVVGAMDRLAIALNNVAREATGFDVSEPRAGTLPTNTGSDAPTRSEMSLPSPRMSTGMTAQQPVLSASMNATLAGSTISAAAAALAASSHSMTATATATAPLAGGTLAPMGTLPTSMTATAPAASVLPNVTLQPSVAPTFDKTLGERPLTEKSIDRMLSDKAGIERVFDRPGTERTFDRPGSEKVFDRVGTEKNFDRPATEKIFERPGAEKTPVSLPPSSGATPLSPSALAAAVAPSPRAKLHVVPTPSASLSASLPSAAAATARIAEAPMNPPPVVPVARSIVDAPMNPVPVAPAMPVVPAVPVAPVARVTETPPPATQADEQSFRVLAVDDSPLMRTFLQNKLAPYGISPEFAASGEEALYKISKQHAAKQRFDLIFLDVMMPGMDGYDVCKMIKKNKENGATKVIMLTSKDKTFDRIRGTMAGCDGYLTKPVDEMKLRAIIERHTPTK